MVVNATEAPTQAEVLFVIEATAANGAYINELKTNYLVPTLEYFHGGALEEGGGNGSVYGVITYLSADCHPGQPVATYGPFTCPQNVVETVDKLQFVGGAAESKACMTEALAAALACFEELGRNDVPRHVILLCCLPPYSAYAGGLVPPGCPGTVEAAARLLGERGMLLSVASARRCAALPALYEHAGGSLLEQQHRNYAKDPRHLVLLRGYSLKERPPSPAPPPAPEIQQDLYSGRGAVAAGGPRPPAPFPRAAPPRAGWLPPPRQPLYAPNSALLTQLAQPSYPPPQNNNQSPLQRMPGMMGAGPPSQPTSGQGPPTSAPQGALPTPGPSGAPVSAQAPQRTYIWSGVLEWMEKGKGPGDQQKVTKHLPCQVSANSKELEPELKVDAWPNKLLMQLMPKQLISSIGGQYLKDSKSVLFHLQPNEALDALTKVMVNGFAGCVHFSPMPSTLQCDIKVLILLYTPDKKAFLGFIPNNQATFVDRLRKVIQQQKQTQIINKQHPGGVQPGAGSGMGPGGMGPSGALPNAPMPGSSGMGGPGGGAGQMGGGQMPQQMQHQQSMINMGGGMPQGGPSGGKGPRNMNQIDGLEAARQQNLEKIQQLQQTLEAAHQQEAQFKSQMDVMTHPHHGFQSQEAQFKSQMDIMSHLQAAQQQEQHYKQLEEQQRKHQLQQQLAQQLARPPHPQRGMRPGMGMPSSNPGLRHLLQQQPQYRPGGPATRPPSQPQQFDDVPNYNDFL